MRQLRTFAKTLQIVTSAALKNKKDRPETYKNWLQKVLKKIFFYIFNHSLKFFQKENIAEAKNSEIKINNVWFKSTYHKYLTTDISMLTDVITSGSLYFIKHF